MRNTVPKLLTFVKPKKMTSEKQTHWLYFKKESDSGYNKQACYGKIDLLQTVRQKLNEGFENIKIDKLKN